MKALIPTPVLNNLKRINAIKKFGMLREYVEPIKQLKNKYSGRVLLLGSGSSSSDYNLSMINDIDIVFMNNCHKHPLYSEIIRNNRNCFHIVAPVHGPSTREYWKNWLGQIVHRDDVFCILGINDYEDSAHKLNLNGGRDIFYYAPLLDRRIDVYKVRNQNYSLENPIFGAGAVSVYALLLACYLGYDDIYLLGVDHSHLNHINSVGRGRFYESSGHTDLEKIPDMEECFINQGNTFLQYRHIRDHFQEKNFINLGGEKSIVDTFQRRDFDSVFD